jgi:hypothetical protein
MSEYLPFWPKAGVLAYVAGSPTGKTEYVYSKALPTSGFTEVVAQLECDAPIMATGGAATGSITVKPEISNDGANWTLAGTNFTAITQGGVTYPVKEVIKITTIAAFMRMRIEITDSANNSNIGGTIMIAGAGRS